MIINGVEVTFIDYAGEIKARLEKDGKVQFGVMVVEYECKWQTGYIPYRISSPEDRMKAVAILNSIEDANTVMLAASKHGYRIPMEVWYAE